MSISAPPKMETERLLLTFPQLEDAPAMYEEYCTDFEVARYLVWQPHENIHITEAFIHQVQRSIANGDGYNWLIKLKSAPERAIGSVAIRMDGNKADIGYCLSKAYWGQGYMPEAAQAVVDWGLSQPEIYRVWAFCDVENVKSARVMEKIGMTYEGTLKRWFVHPNISDIPRDCRVYGIVK